MGKNPVFTVFTPTYNRGDKIHRVYNSLKHQSFRDFEWLIIDDGSTDQTDELISQWQSEAHFPIRYIYQPNQGKHVSINRGVQAASGELFLIFDSDDECVEDALVTFYDYWLNIEPNQRQSFAGITALCQNTQGQIVGDQLPREIVDASSQELKYYHRIQGEKWGFQRSDVLKQFPFPEDDKAEFIPESIIWHSIGKYYKTRYINTALRIYHQQQDSLSAKANINKLANGLRLMHLFYLNNDLHHWFSSAPITFIRSAIHYGRFSFYTGYGPTTQSKLIATTLGRFIWFMALPLSLMAAAKDRIKKNRD